MWQNWKAQKATTQKLKLRQNSTSQIVTKLNNSNCDKTQLKLWQNSENLIFTKLKLWEKKKKKIVIKLKTSNCDTAQFITKLNIWQNFKKNIIMNNLTPWQPMRFTQGNVLQSCNDFLAMHEIINGQKIIKCLKDAHDMPLQVKKMSIVIWLNLPRYDILSDVSTHRTKCSSGSWVDRFLHHGCRPVQLMPVPGLASNLWEILSKIYFSILVGKWFGKLYCLRCFLWKNSLCWQKNIRRRKK